MGNLIDDSEQDSSPVNTGVSVEMSPIARCRHWSFFGTSSTGFDWAEVEDAAVEMGAFVLPTDEDEAAAFTLGMCWADDDATGVVGWADVVVGFDSIQ